jgi:hypothetical protein
MAWGWCTDLPRRPGLDCQLGDPSVGFKIPIKARVPTRPGRAMHRGRNLWNRKPDARILLQAI